MSNNNLYGSNFIEQQRKSGYKSTIYAMAEIVDNSVDAGATQVDIVIKIKSERRGTRTSRVIDEILFLDNGKGMTLDRINGCLTFSSGEGRDDKRIGAFGVGLPNSSISVGRRVDVFSKDETDQWNHVFLDIDDQLSRSEPGYDPAVRKKPDLDSAVEIFSGCRTIVRWSNLDLIDTSNYSILIRRINKLMGRIYRYKLGGGMKMYTAFYDESNANISESKSEVLPYDPMFLMEKKNYITEKIWAAAEGSDNETRGNHEILGVGLNAKEDFTSVHHYKKFVKGCKRNETNLPLFRPHEDYHDQEFIIELGGKEYKFRMKAAYAMKSIRNPGVRAGGATKIGQELLKKMVGDRTDRIRSANIFFVRGGREIDFGTYGLYSVTIETNRFWTIEIHFDSDLDNLMGVSNVKQSVAFRATTADEIENIAAHRDAPTSVMRDRLYHEITQCIQDCIKEMNKQLSAWAKEWKQYEQSFLSEIEGGSGVPTIEPAVIQVLPKSTPWSEERIKDTVKTLKETFMDLSLESIQKQVDLFSEGLTSTIVIYAPNQTKQLYEITRKKGTTLTIINTNHIYYEKIIQPLKSSVHLKQFAVCIEMLISAMAVEQKNLNNADEDKYGRALERYILDLSSTLEEFIFDSHISVNIDEWEKKLAIQD